MLEQKLQAQQNAFRASANSDASSRQQKLRSLKKQISRYQDVFADAAAEDFGGRPAFESRLIEVVGTIWVIDHAIRHCRKWMKPESRWPQLLFGGPNRLHVTYQPKGVVGIVAPWNMPLYLSLGPLAAALAAGNRAMIKLPEQTPASNKVIKTLIAEIFDETEVVLIGEELENPAAFTNLAFDHLIFTGSQNIARSVMTAAAQNLTPLTLELGGKSPAIAAPDYPIEDAALRITHGKIAMSGQVCVAPDYAMVPKEQVGEFTRHAVDAFNQFYPNGVVNRKEYCAVINDTHVERIKSLLEDARQKGATVTSAAHWDGGPKIPMQIVTDVRDDMRLMREEVFGPILPVVGYGNLEDAIAHVNAQPHPLALYLFSKKRAVVNQVLEQTVSGGVTVNDWGWHVVNAAVPFGGVGASGFGSYHGVEGFRELSNARAVFRRHPAFPTEMFHPPVNSGFRGKFQNFWMNLYAGKADPSLGGTPYGEE